MKRFEVSVKNVVEAEDEHEAVMLFMECLHTAFEVRVQEMHQDSEWQVFPVEIRGPDEP